MKDISSREDVELLVREFYKKVRKNERLDYIFDDIIKIDWEHHIPILIDFWESILLDANKYSRNTLAIHFEVNKKVRLEPLHFAEWLELFDTAVDECFAGDVATLAKKRARSIGLVMQSKIEQINNAESRSR